MKMSELLQMMVERNASDIHLKVGSPPMFRLNGRLVPAGEGILTPEITETIASSMMTEQQRRKFEEESDIDFAYSVAGLSRFRANIFRQRGSVGIVMRMIASSIKSFEDLNLPPEQLQKLAMQQRGLILVTGTAGSGKSTTLSVMVDYINSNKQCHILTIEDPIEFLHRDKKSLVNQREVGIDTKSFGSALRYVLREDPDVILIGEMRDLETIEAALSAAETGHLVLSTLHTIDATETINRIIHFFPPHQQTQVRRQLAAVLQGIISMRLIPRSDGSGRLPLCEIMLATEYIRKLIVDPNRTIEIPTAIKEGSMQYGMQTFDQLLQKYYTQGEISYEEAVAYASNPDDFALKQTGVISDSSEVKPESLYGSGESGEKSLDDLDIERIS